MQMNLLERMKESLERLQNRDALRSLQHQPQLIDFCSNDYLGLSRSKELKIRVAEHYSKINQSGSTGSRLLTGQHGLMEELEQQLCTFYAAEAALLFNSGYDANLSLWTALPRRGDLILYDALVHASIHDGMRMGKAETCAFLHNDIIDLERLLKLKQSEANTIFVAIESVYSMDGDIALLEEILLLCERYNAYLIVDEAHATGVLGPKGEGLVSALGIEERIFARVHTFGKAIGGHGAVVLGAKLLRDFLINYARPLIFSTAMPLHTVIHAIEAYEMLENYASKWVVELQEKVDLFPELMKSVVPSYKLLPSKTPIQGVFVPGNKMAVQLATQVQKAGFDVRPIRYPTVAKGQERLRVCLHLFNTLEEMTQLVEAFSRNEKF